MTEEKKSENDATNAEPSDPSSVPADHKNVDSASPEAIARRVAALSEEDPLELQSAEEERKLAERRQASKRSSAENTTKTSKKTELEKAASRRVAQIGARTAPRRTPAVAAEADPLLDRTLKLGEWAKRNQKAVQAAGALLAATLLGTALYLYIDRKNETAASALLTHAVLDEGARIGDPSKDEAENAPPPSEVPMFKTYEERRESALGKYREIETRFPKTGAAILSRLAEGSLLLDKHEPDKAIAAFNEVKASPLAVADEEVKGRALEGLGFAYELKAQAKATPAEATKLWDEAFTAYKELENTVDARGFKELATYHQARVLENRGEKDKAKETLVSLRERLAKPDDTKVSSAPAGPTFPYLREVATERLRELDPSAVPPKGPAPSKGGSPQLSPEQIKKMIEDAQKKQHGGGDPHGH